MSVTVMGAVWKLQLPDSEKIVLLALADCANDEGHCWPGMRSLMRKCCKSDRTIQGCIKSLEAKGHLTRREIVGKGCNYTIHPRIDDTPEAASPPKRFRETPEAASGKPSKKHQSPSGAKAPSVERAKTTFEAAHPDAKAVHAFRLTCVQWAMKTLKWSAADAGIEFDRFVDSNIANGRRYANWERAWHNWCRSDFCGTAKRYADKTAYRREPIRG
jgi:hypothetical protein